MSKPILLFLLCFFTFNIANSQNENNIWCFGINSGVDFNSGNPVSFPGVAIISNTQEGSSSIADSFGNLLFYTDGSKVWNRAHVVMPNGNGLLGNFSTSQGALIVPKPGSSSIYYVFTLDDYNGINGLNYSVVDINQAGGLGDVTSLNNSLMSGTKYSEKMIGIFHSNNTDAWVIVHTSLSNIFHSFQITSSGVNPIPVVSAVGQTYNIDDGVGTMHCTLDGTRIAAAYWNHLSGFEVFDFNKSTGQLTNPIFFNSQNYLSAYSVCFSPSGRFLYGGCFNTDVLYQFDLQAASPTGVLISGTTSHIGDMQLGPDSIIYLVLNGNNFLSAILNPDAAGTACNFSEDVVNLGLGVCQIGIPNYIYPRVNPNNITVNFSTPDSSVCPGTCINFSNSSFNATNYQWLFPGGLPASDNTANPPDVCYLNSGTYDVTLIASNGAASRTLTLSNYINVFPQTPFSPLIQSGDTLFSVPGFSTYLWYSDTILIPGANNYFYVALQNGDYSVQVIDNNGCTALATKIGVVTSIDKIQSDGNRFLVRYSEGNVYLNIFSSNASSSLIELTDALGKIILSDRISIHIGENNISFPIENISQGIYFIRIYNSQTEMSQKILIH